MYVFCIFYQLKHCKLFRFTSKKDKKILISQSRCHGCWWPGNGRNQGIHSHGIDLVPVVPEKICWSEHQEWWATSLKDRFSWRALSIIWMQPCRECYGCFSLYRDHFVYAPSQWGTPLLGNVVSQWLSAFTEWSLMYIPQLSWDMGVWCRLSEKM